MSVIILRRRWILYLALFFFAFIMACLSQLEAKTARRPKPEVKTKKVISQNKNQTPPHSGISSATLHCDARAAVLMDALTGQVLYEQDSSVRIAPASFVKILTLYLAFDALKAGQLKLDDISTVSEKAWRTQGSKMFLKVGDRVRIEDLLKGIAVVSGNDACVALAEHMAGLEEAFVEKMNEKARSIGMKDSRFMNSHGMPVDGQYTTAMDMALLAKRYIEDHPEALALHSRTEYEYNGIRQGNRNTLLQKNIGVDGLKTGHVEEAGYHLLATAKRDGQRMIAVVMGCDRVSKRAPEAQKLLEYGFKNFSTVQVVKKGTAFGPVKVKRGKQDSLELVASDDVWVTVPKGKEKSVVADVKLPHYVVAPIEKGQVIGKVIVQNEGKPVMEASLVSHVSIEKSILPPLPYLAGGASGIVLAIVIGILLFGRRKAKKF